MGKLSEISWTDGTWNPVTGCDEVGPECANCYAKTMANRLRGMGNPSYVHGFEVTIHPRMLEYPLRWSKPSEIFAVSMGDPFHGKVPIAFVALMWWVMEHADWHFFQVLTKRAARMERLVKGFWPQPERAAANIGVGVSVGTVKEGIPRIEHLRRTPARFRFLSVEPMLEDLGQLDLRDIDWVIVGGESSQGARPMSPRWARSIRDQCTAAGVGFHFKQWGSWMPLSQRPTDELDGIEHMMLKAKLEEGPRKIEVDGETMVFVGKKLSGHTLDGQHHQDRPLGLSRPGVGVLHYPGQRTAHHFREALATKLETMMPEILRSEEIRATYDPTLKETR